jgi:osmotically-inducible protein OsmY
MNRTTTIRSAVFMAALFVSTIAAAASSAPAATDITDKFVAAGVQVPDLHAIEVGGIVVLRGNAASAAEAESAGKIAHDLGYTRVANLVRVVEPADDATIQRAAERELSRHRGLDGSNIRVTSLHGVVSLFGHVSHELQKDMAVTLVRNIDGVRGVTTNLER